MARISYQGKLLFDQIDVLDPTDSSRVSGLTYEDFEVFLFKDNSAKYWFLQDGSSLVNQSISSGSVYFNEIPNSPGFYSVRFFPDGIGYWRIILRRILTGQWYSADYDVIPNPYSGSNSSGLIASFT